uniref:Uncharacterized protein n=1 Tax=Branchiostoma floridae TaxID=7739 RepID=C3ZV94_BRAFL|eukprot:XP_002587532.1 hypothetical protein BRAFLDRAFT_129013 [Branchiostoma floridae]
MADNGRDPPASHPGPPHPGPPHPGPDFDVHYHDGYLDWMGFVIALIILIVVVKVIILICWLCGRNKRQGYVRLQGGANNTYHAADATAYTYPVHPSPAQPSAPPPYQNPYQAKDFSTMATAPPAYTAENPPPYSAPRT